MSALPKIYLTLVGILYVLLAIWCSTSPSETSAKVGFSLNGASGKSEFVTVYGGLELGLGLLFLLPWLAPDSLKTALAACVIIHGCLVVFRTVSLWVYPSVESMTKNLAAGEWVILILGIAMIWINRAPKN